MYVQERVLQTITEHRLFQNEDYVVVAVSGGPDSVALLHWLHLHQSNLHIKIACAHFNHGFRGDESDEDEVFVGALCQQWDIPYYHQKVHLQPLVEAGGVNLQVLAREYRYRFLQEVAERIGANVIALAHHQDDQVETIIMRFLRGTGTSGLIGMPYMRTLSDQVKIVRPFLDITKAEILDYLKLHQLSSRMDSSNLKTDYMRNRIRLQLYPELLHYNPNLPSSILALSQMLAEDEVFLQQQALTQFECMTTKREDEISLVLSQFLELPLSLQRRVIKLICNYLSKNEEEVPFLHIEALRTLFAQGVPRQWDLPWSIRVYVRYGEALFKLQHDDNEVAHYHYAFRAPATLQLPTGYGTFFCSITTEMVEKESKYTVYFDYDRIAHDLVLRPRKMGDRIWLEGVGGHKKVKDIFIDSKIPREERESIPLLFAGDELLWIVGVRKSSYGQYDHDTRRYLCCRFEYNEQ